MTFKPAFPDAVIVPIRGGRCSTAGASQEPQRGGMSSKLPHGLKPGDYRMGQGFLPITPTYRKLTEKGTMTHQFAKISEVRGFLRTCMAEKAVTQKELARRLNCDPRQVRRILDPQYQGSLEDLEQAFIALGWQLELRIAAIVSPGG